jgi:hypothetical protein
LDVDLKCDKELKDRGRRRRTRDEKKEYRVVRGFGQWNEVEGSELTNRKEESRKERKKNGEGCPRSGLPQCSIDETLSNWFWFVNTYTEQLEALFLSFSPLITTYSGG